ncbi:phosphorylase family protein [Frigoriglobus tundricola]|uniref:Nucleoside phosphorylase domain-containing protein n=1 Tax=Frigoriglobus tundricola TaxID=2774151 RepID=A0A6M5YZS2_9BACT|nr:hypothetical protein [Frigoriglobus tundricola]QJW99034.1 hypothetical protein FTUN_6631 [Frigoriglobus tundricola]
MSAPREGGVAVLFALEREAAPFRRAVRGQKHVAVCVSGMGRARARRAAEQILRDPVPRLVIAAGFCGALVPALRVGDVVTSPRIITVDHLVTDPAEKRRLGETHDAVDMESSAIAEVCAGRGVAFRAVRAVSDTVDTALSPELARLLSGGNVSPLKACYALCFKPSLLGEFLRLARGTKLAARALAVALEGIVSTSATAAPATASPG